MNDRNSSDINQILRSGYTVDMNGWISRGWEICQSNLGLFIGFFLTTIGIGLVLGLIPFLGSAVSIVIGGPLNAGMLIAAFKVMKGQTLSFNDFFKGFQNSYFVPILLVTLVISAIALACLIPAGIGFGLLVLVKEQQQLAAIVALVSGLLALVGFLAIIYFSISYSFAIPLVIGRKMPFWPAMEASRKVVGKQWFGILGFAFVLGLINFAGALLCGLGLLVTAPLSSCAIAAAYERIFGLPSFDPSQA